MTDAVFNAFKRLRSDGSGVARLFWEAFRERALDSRRLESSPTQGIANALLRVLATVPGRRYVDGTRVGIPPTQESTDEQAFWAQVDVELQTLRKEHSALFERFADKAEVLKLTETELLQAQIRQYFDERNVWFDQW